MRGVRNGRREGGERGVEDWTIGVERERRGLSTYHRYTPE